MTKEIWINGADTKFCAINQEILEGMITQNDLVFGRKPKYD